MNSAMEALTKAGVVPKKGGNDEMIKIQHNLKNNTEDITRYVGDLESWTKEVQKKDKSAALRDPTRNVSLFQNVLTFISIVIKKGG